MALASKTISIKISVSAENIFLVWNSSPLSTQSMTKKRKCNISYAFNDSPPHI